MNKIKLASLAMIAVGVLGVSGSAFAASSATATYTITTATPSIGLSTNAPTTITAGHKYGLYEDYGNANTQDSPVTVTNTGNVVEFLNISAAAPTGYTLNSTDANNTAIVHALSGSPVNNSVGSSNPLASRQMGVYLTDPKGLTVAVGSTPVDYNGGTTGTNLELDYTNDPALLGTTADTLNFQVLTYAGDSGTTLNVPITITATTS